MEGGLEFLPLKIVQLSSEAATQGKDTRTLNLIDCQPLRDDAKVTKIQEQLRPFNYDLEAWQLAHPEKMLVSRPEYFTNPDSKDKWINALGNKIVQSQQELQETKTNLPEKVKRIERLESKINHLTIIKNLLEELAIERDHSQDINEWYKRQLDGEGAKKRNDLWNMILELKWNSKQREQEIKELKQNLEVVNKIAEQEISEKETANKETQTEITSQDFEQLTQAQETIQKLQEQINKKTKYRQYRFMLNFYE